MNMPSDAVIELRLKPLCIISGDLKSHSIANFDLVTFIWFVSSDCSLRLRGFLRIPGCCEFDRQNILHNFHALFLPRDHSPVMDPRHFQVLVPFFSIAIVTNMKIVWQNMNCMIASNKALHIRNDIRITLQTFLVFKCARLCAPNYANHLFLGFLAQTYVSSALTWCAHVSWPR